MENIERAAMVKALEYANTLVTGLPIAIPDAIAVLEKANPTCELTKDQQKAIVDRYRCGKASFEALSKEYGCSILQVVRIWEQS